MHLCFLVVGLLDLSFSLLPFLFFGFPLLKWPKKASIKSLLLHLCLLLPVLNVFHVSAECLEPLIIFLFLYLFVVFQGRFSLLLVRLSFVPQYRHLHVIMFLKFLFKLLFSLLHFLKDLRNFILLHWVYLLCFLVWCFIACLYIYAHWIIVISIAKYSL